MQLITNAAGKQKQKNFGKIVSAMYYSLATVVYTVRETSVMMISNGTKSKTKT